VVTGRNDEAGEKFGCVGAPYSFKLETKLLYRVRGGRKNEGAEKGKNLGDRCRFFWAIGWFILVGRDKSVRRGKGEF